MEFSGFGWRCQIFECAMRLTLRSRTMPAKAATIRTREDHALPSTITRVEALDWSAMGSGLDAQGCAVTGPLLTAKECAELAARYAEDKPFRSRVIMARHGFG